MPKRALLGKRNHGVEVFRMGLSFQDLIFGIVHIILIGVCTLIYLTLGLRGYPTTPPITPIILKREKAEKMIRAIDSHFRLE